MQHDTTQEKNRKTTQSDQSEEKTHPRVRCNGGGAQGSGHPAVYLSLNEEGFVVCPYCSRRFEKNS